RRSSDLWCPVGMWGRWWRFRTSAVLLPCPALLALDGLGGRWGRRGLVRRLRGHGCVQRWRAWLWCWCGGGRSLGLLCAVYVSGKSGTDHCQAFLARACALLGVVQLDQQQIGVFSHRFSIRSRLAWMRSRSRCHLMCRAYSAMRLPCVSASVHVARVFHA